MKQKRLSLNFAPVSLSGDTIINIGCRPYDHEVLRDLRNEYAETHIFRWDRSDDAIVDIPVVAGAQPLGNTVAEIDLSNEYRFWPDLLNAALLRVFAGKRDILRGYPVQVLGHEKFGLISHPQLPPWIQKRTLQEIHPRTIYGGNGKPVFGMFCDVRVKQLLLGSCDQLLARGVPIMGRYVLANLPHNDKRLMPRRQLVGRISEIKNGTLYLDDHRDNFETIKSSEAWLQAGNDVFEECVRKLVRGEAESLLNKSKTKAATIHSGPGRIEAINTLLNFLRSSSLEALPGVNFKINTLMDGKNCDFPASETIPKPALVFDPSGARTDVWNERGIKKNGPFDQRVFSPKKLNIAVICQAQHEGRVEAFTAKFLEGMPEVMSGSGNNKQARYGDGFLRRFQLEKANVQTFTANAPTIEAYLDACNTALQKAADDGIKWDLALVQIEERFKALPGSSNPYYGTKALLLKNHVAVQNVRLETMNQPDSNLVFSMNQMSLASYAKLGGRPWLLGAEQKVAHELVIGIGSHTATKSRIGSGVRYVGITTVFSSDGSYHLAERTNVVSFADYTKALTETLKRTITRVREQDNWRNTDRVRLIFHMFKPAKDVEAKAIKAVVEGLELENVTYAFLHIATQHPFLVFDHEQKGLPHWNPVKGVLGPSRGLHLKLGDHQSLIVFSGASELKQETDGLPRPCLLNLHASSTFKDMTYLARQAFDFTAHSWRIMSPEAFPVTIKYSDLIAERLTGLNQIDFWDNDAVKFREIGRTPWFL